MDDNILSFIIDKITEIVNVGSDPMDYVDKIKLDVIEEFNTSVDSDLLLEIIAQDKVLRDTGFDELTVESVKKVKRGAEEKRPKYTRVNNTYEIYTKRLIDGQYKDHNILIHINDLRKLVRLYCVGQGGPTMNKVCRTMDITRKDFYAIKTAFGFTKDSPPVIDDDFLNNVDENELIEKSLEQKQKNFLEKLEEKEVKTLRRQVERLIDKQYQRERLFEDLTDELANIDFSKNIIIPSMRKNVKSKKMLEIPIFDLHLGKLAWAGEGYFGNYDHNIAKERFNWVIGKILNDIKGTSFEKILLPIGSDFFNFDNRFGTTEKGTPQENSLRYSKMFRLGFELYVNAINTLCQYAPVHGFLVRGNHDETTSEGVAFALGQGFTNNQNVTIDDTSHPRKYIPYGINLIGYSHGNKEKGRIFLNMQDEVPQLWANSKYREWHLGHYHSEQVISKGSVKTRHLSSLTDPDTYHNEHGYVGNVAETHAFIWNKTDGLDNIIPAIILRGNL